MRRQEFRKRGGRCPLLYYPRFKSGLDAVGPTRALRIVVCLDPVPSTVSHVCKPTTPRGRHRYTAPGCSAQSDSIIHVPFAGCCIHTSFRCRLPPPISALCFCHLRFCGEMRLWPRGSFGHKKTDSAVNMYRRRIDLRLCGRSATLNWASGASWCYPAVTACTP